MGWGVNDYPSDPNDKYVPRFKRGKIKPNKQLKEQKNDKA